MLDLQGKCVLITGGNRGIGKEIGLTLAKAGCNIAIAGRDVATSTEVANEIMALGVKAVAITCDVANAESVAALFKTYFESFDTLDILVNNAGITRDGLIVRMKEDDWDSVLDTNLKSAFLCCKEAFRPMMKAKGGCIINMSSVVGLTGNAGQANYTASKAGLIGLTKTLAKEFASRNIRVNAIAPGFIATDMTDKLTVDQKSAITASIPMQKLGTPKDIAHAVAFLASSLSSYITGQVLTVDGGLVM